MATKYDMLRTRFFNDFYFKGRVAVTIDKSVAGGKVIFGDQTIYMGQVLMVLASEIAARKRAGLPPSDAEQRIKEVLDGFEELDWKGEKYTNPQLADELNGFFVRDDITGPGDLRLNGRFQIVNSDWQDPQLENATPSGDQLFGMMFGLLCVVKYSGNVTLAQQALENSARMYDYARRCDFILELPNGNPTRRGSDVRWLASLLHGINKAITGMDWFNQSKIKVGGFELPLTGIAAFWDADNTPATIASLAGQKITIPILGTQIELNSFALHIMLMALAVGEVWAQSEIENVGLKCNHHLAILWNCQLHGTKPQGFSKDTIQSFLDACPETGPRSSLNSNSGWQHDNRWIRCSNIYEPDDGPEEYNGLDWLLLSNMMQLVYS